MDTFIQTNMVQNQGTSAELCRNSFSPKLSRSDLYLLLHELLQVCKLFIKYLWNVMTTAQFHLLYSSLKENISVRDAGLYQSKTG